jgi:hypothetical protein
MLVAVMLVLGTLVTVNAAQADPTVPIHGKGAGTGYDQGPLQDNQLNVSLNLSHCGPLHGSALNMSAIFANPDLSGQGQAFAYVTSENFGQYVLRGTAQVDAMSGLVYFTLEFEGTVNFAGRTPILLSAFDLLVVVSMDVPGSFYGTVSATATVDGTVTLDVPGK